MAPFDIHGDLIIIPVRLQGPQGEAVAQFALDTGATETVVRVGLLLRVGYDLQQAAAHVSIATAGGTQIVPRIRLQGFEALGESLTRWPVLALDFPPSAAIDGLLGLDFIRGMELCINYRSGQVSLA